MALAPVQSSCFARVGCTDLPLLGFVTVERSSRTESPSDVFPFIDVAAGVHSRRALRLCIGNEGATLAACSALVVLRHLGGFLLRTVRGLVASRCRSWGSSRFRRLRLVRTVREDRTPSRSPPFPRRLSYPSKDLPRLQPHHVTVAVAPLMLARTFRRGCSSRRFQRLVSPSFRCERHLRGFAQQSSP